MHLYTIPFLTGRLALSARSIIYAIFMATIFLVSLFPARADIILSGGSAYGIATVHSSENPPGPVYENVGNAYGLFQPLPGSDSFVGNETMTSTDTADSAGAITSYSENFSLSGENLSFSGSGNGSAASDSTSNYTLDTEAQDGVSFDITTDMPLYVTLSLSGTGSTSFSSTNADTRNYSDLYFDVSGGPQNTYYASLSHSGSASFVLPAHEDFAIRVEDSVGYQTADNTPADPQTVTGEYQFSFSFDATDVPEPSSAWMMCAGSLCLSLFFRFRTARS